MRGLYIYLILSVILVIMLIAFSFLFFEKGKHEALFYVIERGAEKIGYIRLDQYVTEDKIVLKSTRHLPKETGGVTVSEKFSFYRENFYLDKFIKEYSNGGKLSESIVIKDNGKTLDFLTIAQSKFSALDNIAHDKDLSVFDEESVITYLPFLQKYNFAVGGSQSFNALYHPFGLFPPAAGRVVFTSIKDDFLLIGGKRVKAECIVVKTKLLPVGYLWVSKKDKSVLRLEIRGKNILMKKTAHPPRIAMESFAIKSDLYQSQEILFPSGDIALGGTVLVPKKDGKLPAVLLVAGAGPYNRENAGLYTGASSFLAKNGYAVLYYDKRGIGRSQGDNFAASLTDEVKDIESALKFLSNHEKVDNKRMFIVAHSEGATYSSALDFTAMPVRGVVMLAPVNLVPLADFGCEYMQNVIKIMTVLDKKYPQVLDALVATTLGVVKNTKKDYAFVQKKYVYIKRMSEILQFSPLEGFKKMKMPILVITGKKDEFGSLDYTKNMERSFAEADFKDCKVIAFRELGHLLGDVVDRIGTVMYLSANQEVLETIRLWLEDKSRPESPAEAPLLDVPVGGPQA